MANRGATAPRMRKEWQSINGTFQSMTAAGTVIGANLPFTNPTTVLRMLGSYILGSTGVATAGDECAITVGIGVVSTDAATLGATAMPDPGGEPDYPWLYWASHVLFFPSTAAATVEQGDKSIVGQARVAFDIKSMRKISPRQSLIWVAEYVDSSGTPPIRWSSGITRVLVGLH